MPFLRPGQASHVQNGLDEVSPLETHTRSWGREKEVGEERRTNYLHRDDLCLCQGECDGFQSQEGGFQSFISYISVYTSTSCALTEGSVCLSTKLSTLQNISLHPFENG